MKNREIKFRVWDRCGQPELCTCKELKFDNVDKQYYIPDVTYENRFIYQQFTGTLDETEAELYEL